MQHGDPHLLSMKALHLASDTLYKISPLNLASITNSIIFMKGRREIVVSHYNIIFNNYWTRLRKVSWFVSVLRTLISHYILRQLSSIIVLWFDHQVCFHMLITPWQLRKTICHFSPENVVSITHGQNIICSKTRLDGTTHKQTIICGQLFARHVVGSRPMERKKKCIEW